MESTTKKLTPLAAVRHLFHQPDGSPATASELRGLKKTDLEELKALCMEHYVKNPGAVPAGYTL